MRKSKLWYGILEAGKKSCPVAIDRNLDTGEINTVFIYNHNRKEILKYVRELVEPKLRELSAKEKKLEVSLKKGFTEALKTIKYKVAKPPKAPEKDIPAPVIISESEGSEVVMNDLDDVDWDESEMA
jgi:hypothetical protein